MGQKERAITHTTKDMKTHFKLMCLSPIISPNTGPPRESLQVQAITSSVSQHEFFVKALNMTLKKTIAVPSFIKASPSINVPNLSSTPKSFNRATTATGSVALNLYNI